MRYAIRVTGHVQGVGFRFTCRQTASHFPVTGWVRNEPDGSVHIEAEGAVADLDAFVNALKSSRVGGFIRDFLITECPDSGRYHDFSILH